MSTCECLLRCAALCCAVLRCAALSHLRLCLRLPAAVAAGGSVRAHRQPGVWRRWRTAAACPAWPALSSPPACTGAALPLLSSEARFCAHCCPAPPSPACSEITGGVDQTLPRLLQLLKPHLEVPPLKPLRAQVGA